MKIHVRSRSVQLDEPVRAHVERRLQFSLGHLAPRIQRAMVSLADVNGPRGGEDKLCRIEVRLRPTGTVFVEASDVDLFAAVDHSADRAANAVSRALKRSRDRARDGETLATRVMSAA